jgi:hypothetical protein
MLLWRSIEHIFKRVIKRFVVFWRRLFSFVIHKVRIAQQTENMSFESAKLKVERAKIHIDTLESSLRKWIDSNPSRITKHINADCTRFSVTLNWVSDPLLEEWGLIFGDCVHNLRSALDHVVYAAVKDKVNPIPADRINKIQFPIVDQPTSFQGAVGGNRIEILDQTVIDVIDSFQPYNRGLPKTPPLLALLRDFNNSDKHRLITPTIFIPSQAGFEFSKPTKGIGNVKVITESVVDGAEILCATFDQPNPNNDFKCVYNVLITVNHLTGPQGHTRGEPIEILRMSADEVIAVTESIEKIAP